MSDESIRIRLLMRWTIGGNKWRALPEEERTQEVMEKAKQEFSSVIEKWKSDGVKHLGYWNGAPVDGFCHYSILEVDHIGKVRQMNVDLNNVVAKFWDTYEIQIGFSGGNWEKAW